jgi:enoyl-CoA hydratase
VRESDPTLTSTAPTANVAVVNGTSLNTLGESSLQDSPFFKLRRRGDVEILQLQSEDGTNRLTKTCVLTLHAAVRNLAVRKRPLIIAGNESFFSVGADLTEIFNLTAVQACEFSRTGQALMNAIEGFPAPVVAAVSGFCMGGGFDLALACHQRVAAPNAVFGHRGAALGLLTGGGGTQRLSRLVGRAHALGLLTRAERVSSQEALRLGLVDDVARDPVEEGLLRLAKRSAT